MYQVIAIVTFSIYQLTNDFKKKRLIKIMAFFISYLFGDNSKCCDRLQFFLRVTSNL